MILKQFREKTGLTQREAANKMKLNPGFWSRIESGFTELPTRHYLKASKLLKVPIEKLIDLRVAKFKHKLTTKVSKCQ